MDIDTKFLKKKNTNKLNPLAQKGLYTIKSSMTYSWNARKFQRMQILTLIHCNDGKKDKNHVTISIDAEKHLTKFNIAHVKNFHRIRYIKMYQTS